MARSYPLSPRLKSAPLRFPSSSRAPASRRAEARTTIVQTRSRAFPCETQKRGREREKINNEEMKGTISGANRPDTDALIAALRGGFVLRGRGEVFEEARFKARYVIYIYIHMRRLMNLCLRIMRRRGNEISTGEGAAFPGVPS